MTILLFGAAGQVGQELTALANRRGVPLVALSRAEGDIADPDRVQAALARINPSVVVNAAAYTKVDKAESEADEAYRANCIGPGVLAEASAVAGIPLIHLSTDYVFDGTKATAYTEDDLVAPLGVYGHTKEAGERAVRAANAHHIILRTSWVYGVYGANFLKTMMRLSGERDELRVVADQRGNPTATADIAEGILAVINRMGNGDAVPWGTYHLTGTGATTWHGFAQEIVAACGRATTVTAIATHEYPTPARRPANSELDGQRFRTAFGYAPAPWQDRTRAVVAALLHQQTGQ